MFNNGYNLRQSLVYFHRLDGHHVARCAPKQQVLGLSCRRPLLSALFLLMATIEGSFTTMPLPRA